MAILPPLGIGDLPEAIIDFFTDQVLKLQYHVLVELTDDQPDCLLHSDGDLLVHALLKVLQVFLQRNVVHRLHVSIGLLFSGLSGLILSCGE